jgi:hypothetical protein
MAAGCRTRAGCQMPSVACAKSPALRRKDASAGAPPGQPGQRLAGGRGGRRASQQATLPSEPRRPVGFLLRELHLISHPPRPTGRAWPHARSSPRSVNSPPRLLSFPPSFLRTLTVRPLFSSHCIHSLPGACSRHVHLPPIRPASQLAIRTPSAGARERRHVHAKAGPAASIPPSRFRTCPGPWLNGGLMLTRG